MWFGYTVTITAKGLMGRYYIYTQCGWIFLALEAMIIKQNTNTRDQCLCMTFWSEKPQRPQRSWGGRALSTPQGCPLVQDCLPLQRHWDLGEWSLKMTEVSCKAVYSEHQTVYT